jgi:dimeric dUTPase (all-alpha-NTP-PPase superfamily)
MKANQKTLNKLYGSEIEKIDFNFRLNTIDILLKSVEGDVVKKFRLLFSGVSNFKMTKDWVDEKWEVIGVAEIFYIPELGKKYSISDEIRQSYNYMFDGDAYELYIKANKLEIQEIIL